MVEFVSATTPPPPPIDTMKLQIPTGDFPLCWQCLIVNEYRGSADKVEVVVSASDAQLFVCRNQPLLVRGGGGDLAAPLFTSNGVSFALANATLRQDGSFENQCDVLNWLDFAKSEISLAVESWVFPHMGLMEARKANIDAARAQLKTALGVVDAHLATRTFLVAERLTLADIGLFCALFDAITLLMDKAFLAGMDNLVRWANTVGFQEPVARVVGQLKWCEKAPADIADGQRGSLKRRPVQTKKAEAPVAAATAAAAPPTATADEGKDPFAALPKGTFVMDEFKRVYSNNDTATVALPYFWDKFDAQNYSVWSCVYKYPEELKLTFMTANLVSGMMQRLDKMRKHSFASMCIFGEDNNNQISGIWIWRGQELAFELSPDFTIDYESYTWKKLNPGDEADKKLINGYLLWEIEHEGKKFKEGKIFK